ncbi:MAG: GGDEF domain-containing protein [Gammaproteobacteria bacterium]|nr:GGDEF domain-containing protein [Gammaproteobacteria bacterium]
MPETRFRSLHHKLLFSISIVAVLLAVISSVLAYYVEFDRASRHTEKMLTQLLDTVENTASIAVYVNNEEMAKDVLNGLLKNDIIQGVKLSSEQGFYLSQSKDNSQNTDGKIERQLTSPFSENYFIGTLHIIPDSHFIQSEAMYSAMFSVLTSIALIAITSLIVYLLINNNLSKPLELISNTLHDIKNGAKRRLPVFNDERHDELSRLTHDINSLLTALDAKFNDEHLLRQSIETLEKNLRHSYDSASAGLFLLNKDGKLVSFNNTLKVILDKVGINIDDYAHRSDFSNENNDQTVFSGIFNDQDKFNIALIKTINSNQLETLDISLAADEKSTQTWLHCLMSKSVNPSGDIQIEGVVFDITERIKTEQSIKYQASHDALTGLLRRHAAQAAFEHFYTNNKDCKAYCFLMDLDGFKWANDTYGHAVGDKVLAITAERLKNSVRATDIVSRLGGDEFLIISFASGLDGYQHNIAHQIVNAIQAPMNINEQTTVSVGISVGISMSHQYFDNAFEIMMIEADKAMYEVKRKGKNGYCYKGNDEAFKINLIRNDSSWQWKKRLNTAV